MSIEPLIALFGIFFTGWAALWFRLGKLSSEVRQHNKMLTEIQKAIERILTRGGS